MSEGSRHVSEYSLDLRHIVVEMTPSRLLFRSFLKRVVGTPDCCIRASWHRRHKARSDKSEQVRSCCTHRMVKLDSTRCYQQLSLASVIRFGAAVLYLPPITSPFPLKLLVKEVTTMSATPSTSTLAKLPMVSSRMT